MGFEIEVIAQNLIEHGCVVVPGDNARRARQNARSLLNYVAGTTAADFAQIDPATGVDVWDYPVSSRAPGTVTVAWRPDRWDSAAAAFGAIIPSSSPTSPA